MGTSNKTNISLSTYIFILYILLLGSDQSNLFGQSRALIPLPVSVEWNNQKFFLNKPIEIISPLVDDGYISLFLKEKIESQYPDSVDDMDNLESPHRKFQLYLSDDLPENILNREEAYHLIVRNDSVVLKAETKRGLIFGLQTLNQLIAGNEEPYIAGCEIIDWPAFSMRGFMIDAGRNFIPVPMLKEIIDVMAAYKFNIFHLHLTDNPGWRLESKKYPFLTDSSTMSRWHGKYYSQAEFLELIDYCYVRNITLIPEIDVPGHSEAFRNAFKIDSMSDPVVEPILTDLLDEICNLVPGDKMPFIHLGTDEVWNNHERPAPELLPNLIKRITFHNREPLVWRPGYKIKNDTVSITQLWSSGGKPKRGHRHLDSRLNYLNHLDPLAGIAQLYFDRIGGRAYGDSLCLGGILCCWNDNNVEDIYDIIRQNPVYPGLVTYSETSWHGQKFKTGNDYLAKLPVKGEELHSEFCEFEERLIQHRELYFKGKPFPYVKQTGIEWKLIGPFDNKGDVNMHFPVEDTLASFYLVDSVVYSWKGPIYGGTIHIKHFFNYPSYFSENNGTVYAFTRIWSPEEQLIDAWIGFNDWSRSGGRRGGPFPLQGKWHNTNPLVWINNEMIAPPLWNNPGLSSNTENIPFSDENFSFRKPAKVKLKTGWNTILLKVPKIESSWKWMFTFVPINSENGFIRELSGIKFSQEIELQIKN